MKITNNTTLRKAAGVDGNHAAGRGCYLSVRGGSQRWVYRYFPNGKAKEVPLGTYTAMSLADARIAADGLRHARKVEKIDPRLAINSAKPAATTTFEQDTLTYHAYAKGAWDADHARLWLQSMQRHVFPKIGGRDTTSLTVADIVGVLEPLWEGKHETAIRLHGRIRCVIEHAMDTDDHERFEHGNPADRVLKRLPRGFAREAIPHPALPWQDAPALYQRLAAMPDHRDAIALRLLLLCCTPRTAEIVKARWDEIECERDDGFTPLSGDVFHVPADRMKSGNARDIPLCRAAMELLAMIRLATTDDFIFPATRAGKTLDGVFIPCGGHMRVDGMQVLLREEMGLPWTVHGLRATFRSWVTAHARSVIDHDAAEIALDHVIGSRVHRAYDRADLIAERRELAERWAKFLGAF